MFCHVATISFRNVVSQDTRDEILNMLRSLGEKCGGRRFGVVSWNVGKNLDVRKKNKHIHLVEVAIFEDEDAFNNFCQNPVHREAGETLAKIADWNTSNFIMSGDV